MNEEWLVLPKHLQDVLGSSQVLVSEHLSAWSPSRRQQVYDALGDPEDPRTRRSRAWLATLAGKKVLPLCVGALTALMPSLDLPARVAKGVAFYGMEPFTDAAVECVAQATLSDPLLAGATDNAVKELLALARNVKVKRQLFMDLAIVCDLVPLSLVIAERLGQGTLKPDDFAVHWVWDMGYHRFGHTFLEFYGALDDLSPPLAVPVALVLAVNTAHWAVEEAQGRAPLANGDGIEATINDRLTGLAFDGDAASACALTGALRANNVVDLTCLSRMWGWWLADAVPQAWVKSHQL